MKKQKWPEIEEEHARLLWDHCDWQDEEKTIRLWKENGFIKEKKCYFCDGTGIDMPTQGDFFPEKCGFCKGTGKKQ